ncbi:MAG TPA: ATP-binding protein [Thermoanaerobaculia bacterium]|nr:ATP-binding protein [Thermoanaerobaculia bacterium]
MRDNELLCHLDIGSRFENVELVQVMLADALDDLGFDDESRHWIEVAVREAVANAIKHGNRQDPGKRVEVDLSLEGADLVIQVLDQGEGFEPEGVADPLDPVNLMRVNGRGIFFMQRFMDSIDYDRAPGGGTVVTMRKRVPNREST